jgi:hypothetical protein
MSDQSSIDLQALDPGDPPDLVGPAVRRFRVRVVLLTVIAVVATAAVMAASVIGVVTWKNRGEDINDYLSPTQLALLAGGTSNCSTPSFDLGDATATLLQAARTPERGWALLFTVESNDGHPLAVHKQTEGGGSAVRFSALGVLGTTETGQISAAPGWTVGTAYVGAPAAAGDRLTIQLIQFGEVTGSFKLDLSDGPGCKR